MTSALITKQLDLYIVSIRVKFHEDIRPRFRVFPLEKPEAQTSYEGEYPESWAGLNPG